MTVIDIPSCAIVGSTVYAGLYLQNAPVPAAVPLLSVHAEVKVVDTVVETQLTQTYINLEAMTVQAKYVFPLYEKAAVTAFSAEIDGRIVEGVAKEKLQAKQEYSAAVARGDGAYLLEQERPDVFMCSVGNLPPSKLVTVRIKYCHELSVQDKTLRLLLPAHIAPRYNPAHDYEGRLSPVMSSLTYASPSPTTVYQPTTTPGHVAYLPAWLHDPLHPFCRYRRPRLSPVLVPVQQPATTRYVPFTLPAQQPPRFSVQVVVEASSDITAVSSPSHANELLVTKLSNRSVEASFVLSSVFLNKDFVLSLSTAEFAKPRVLWEAYAQDSEESLKMGGYGGCAMLTMVPKFATDSMPSECIFVIDRSGSMSGGRIEQTKKALHLFLRSLPEGSYFNFVSFGDSYSCWRPSSVMYSEQTLKDASSFVDTIGANMGGTEILRPLQHILAHTARNAMPRPPAGFSRQLFVLTDGEVTNEPQVVDSVKQWCADHSARVFSLGIGSGVSTFLVEGIARNGHGTARFVQDNEDLRPVVVSLMQQAVAPALTDLKLEWHCPEESAAPAAAAAAPAPEAPAVPVPSAPPAGPRSFFDAQAITAFEATAAKPAPLAAPLKAAVRSGVHQAPFVAPTIHSGSHFVAFAFFPSNKRPDYVTLRASSPDGPLELRLPLEDANRRGPAVPLDGEAALVAAKPDGLLHRLAARAMLRDLEEGNSYLHSATHGARPHPSEVAAEGVRLGTSFGLASKWTSFVAIERRANGTFSELSDFFAIGRPTVERNVPQFGCAPQLACAAPMMFPQQQKRSVFSSIGSAFTSMFAAAPSAAPCAASFSAPCAASSSASFGKAQRRMMKKAVSAKQCENKAMDLMDLCHDECEEEDAFCDFAAAPAAAAPQATNGAFDDDVFGFAAAPAAAAQALPQPPQAPGRGAPVDVVGGLTLEQEFNGSFKPSDKVFGLLGVSRQALAAVAQSQGVSETAVCSAAVVVVLRERFSSQQGVWCMMVEKTNKFLNKELGSDANGVAALLAAVQAVVVA